MLKLVPITNDQRELIAPEWLARAEAVHRELRPQLQPEYVAQMHGIFADGGEMVIAVEDEVILGVAVFRQYRDTFSGSKFYVDDLVTTSQRRSQGVGKALLDWLQDTARRRGASNFTLDSGTQRTDAHRFYFREGLTIPSFNFKKAITTS